MAKSKATVARLDLEHYYGGLFRRRFKIRKPTINGIEGELIDVSEWEFLATIRSPKNTTNPEGLVTQLDVTDISLGVVEVLGSKETMASVSPGASHGWDLVRIDTDQPILEGKFKVKYKKGGVPI